MGKFVDDTLTSDIIYCVLRVHRRLGPGFLEVVYRRALAIELGRQSVAYEMEKEVLVYYDGEQVGRHVLDLIVADTVIVEVKAVEVLGKAHYAQARAYLKATGLPVALLVNFSQHRADFRRIEGDSRTIFSRCPERRRFL